MKNNLDIQTHLQKNKNKDYSINHSNEIIGDALNRKTTSENYSIEYPKFLRSNGPFNIYDHAKKKGLGNNLLRINN